MAAESSNNASQLGVKIIFNLVDMKAIAEIESTFVLAVNVLLA